MSIRIALVGENRMFLQAICRIIDSTSGMHVVAFFSNGATAIQTVSAAVHDLAIVSYQLPDMTGDKVIRSMVTIKSFDRILGITDNDDVTCVRRMAIAGSRGFVSTVDQLDDLLSAIRTIAAGGTFFETSTVRDALSIFGHRLSPFVKLSTLTRRELEVFDLRIKGWQNRSIASKLGVAESTVSGHYVKLQRKLGCSDFAELMKFAIEGGFVI